MTTLGLAGLIHADSRAFSRRDFMIYVDEFQTYATLSVAYIISDLRKFRIGLTLAHQSLCQLEPEVRYAVLGARGRFARSALAQRLRPTSPVSLNPSSRPKIP